MKDSANFGTVVIEAASGEVLDFFQGFAGDLTLYQGKIVVASRHQIRAIDLQTKKMEDHSVVNQLQEAGLEIHWRQFEISDQKLFFIGGGARMNNQIGILDLDSFELLWHAFVDIEDDVNHCMSAINFCQDRLLLSCSGWVLKIFERI